MCFKTPKIDKPAAIQPAPDRTSVDTEAQRRRLTTQGGVANNIFTSALGDTAFGKNASKLATLGASL